MLAGALTSQAHEKREPINVTFVYKRYIVLQTLDVISMFCDRCRTRECPSRSPLGFVLDSVYEKFS